MATLNRFLRTPLGQFLLVVTSVLYLRLIHRSVRWRIERPAATEALFTARAAFIACFWHGRLATMRAAWPRHPGAFHMLISGHRDGALIARAIAKLGFGTVAGSSRRRGAIAVRALQQKLAAGNCVGITPDGPRGPRMRAKLGAVKAAQLAGVPILPVSGSASRCRFVRSWDRFCFVKPFGRGLLLFGEPLAVPREADAAELEALRAELERRLNALTAEADRRCGQPGIEPAPLPDAGRARDALQESLSDNGAPGKGDGAAARGAGKIGHAGA
jgi:lysophospholipid acyltransferase (LPLAT)-like uncharacterized protein